MADTDFRYANADSGNNAPDTNIIRTGGESLATYLGNLTGDAANMFSFWGSFGQPPQTWFFMNGNEENGHLTDTSDNNLALADNGLYMDFSTLGSDGPMYLIMNATGSTHGHFVRGNVQQDALTGGDGADTLFGGADNDILEGNGGADSLVGGGGADSLDGDRGDDRLMGGKGADTLQGEDDNDTLGGGAGDDVLVGGLGNDHLTGGAGADTVAGRGDYLDGDTFSDMDDEDMVLFAGLDLVEALDGTPAGDISYTYTTKNKEFEGTLHIQGPDLDRKLFSARLTDQGDTEVTLTAAPSPGPAPSPAPAPSPGPSPVPAPAPAPAPAGGNITQIVTDATGNTVATKTESVPGGTKVTIGGDGDTGGAGMSLVVDDNTVAQVKGPPAPEEKTQAALTVDQTLNEIFADQGESAGTVQEIRNQVATSLEALPEGVQALTRLVALESANGEPLAIELSADAADDVTDIVVVDARNAAGSTLNLINVKGTVVVVGAVQIVGSGNSDQTLIGDDEAQIITITDTVEAPAGLILAAGGALVSGGADSIATAGGADQVRSGAGRDTVSAGADDDLVYGNQDSDRLYGNQGSDRLYAGQAGDDVFGGQGGDIVYGNRGDDAVYGNRGADTVFGGQGADGLFGGTGADMIHGNAGSDTLNGGQGDDELFGGAGSDVFVLSAGADRAKDFSTSEGDLLMIAADQAGGRTAADILAMMSEDPDGNAVLNLDGRIITLEGTGLAGLTSNDILLV